MSTRLQLSSTQALAENRYFAELFSVCFHPGTPRGPDVDPSSLSALLWRRRCAQSQRNPLHGVSESFAGSPPAETSGSEVAFCLAVTPGRCCGKGATSEFYGEMFQGDVF